MANIYFVLVQFIWISHLTVYFPKFRQICIKNICSRLYNRLYCSICSISCIVASLICVSVYLSICLSIVLSLSVCCQLFILIPCMFGVGGGWGGLIMFFCPWIVHSWCTLPQGGIRLAGEWGGGSTLGGGSGRQGIWIVAVMQQIFFVLTYSLMTPIIILWAKCQSRIILITIRNLFSLILMTPHTMVVLLIVNIWAVMNLKIQLIKMIS